MTFTRLRKILPLQWKGYQRWFSFTEIALSLLATEPAVLRTFCSLPGVLIWTKKLGHDIFLEGQLMIGLQCWLISNFLILRKDEAVLHFHRHHLIIQMKLIFPLNLCINFTNAATLLRWQSLNWRCFLYVEKISRIPSQVKIAAEYVIAILDVLMSLAVKCQFWFAVGSRCSYEHSYCDWLLCRKDSAC